MTYPKQQEECTHRNLGHCGSTYMCFDCGLKGDVIRALWIAPRSK